MSQTKAQLVEGLNINSSTPADSLVIDSSGNVGIGQSNPSGKLEVSGGFVTLRNGASSFPDGISAPVIYGSTGGGSGTFNESGNLVLQSRSDAGSYNICMVTGDTPTERLRIDSSGNVGISNTTPASFQSGGRNLVVGANSAEHGITIYSTTSGNLYFADGTSGSAKAEGYVQYRHDNNRLDFGTSNSLRMSIDSSGNVGIGTSSPQGELHLHAGDANGFMRITNTTTGSTGSDGALFQMNGNDLNINNLESGNFIFHTADTERMRIDSSGNVGIGTASPGTKLEINGSIGIARTAGGYTFRETVGGNERAGMHSSSGNDLIFNTGGASEQMRIDTSGRVGIGVSTMAGGSSSVTILRSSALRWADSDGTQRADIYGDSSSNLVFRNGTGSTERMRIDSSGNVGINQVPTRELSLHSPNNNNALIHFTNDDTGEASGDGILVGLDGSENMVINNQETGKTINFYNGGSERMRIDSSGRLLVGTSTAPSSTNTLLAVHCPISSSSAGAIQISQNTSGANKAAASLGIVVQNGGESTNAADLTFNTASGGSLSERLRIDSSGNLTAYSGSTDGNYFVIRGKHGPGNDYNRSEVRFGVETNANGLGFLAFATGNNTASERMRITSGGNVLIGQTNGSFGTVGTIFTAGGQSYHTVSGDTVLFLNRHTNDGEIVRIAQGDVTEGNISVSGSTVSYNGGHLARWSQLAAGAERTEILRGSVLSNLDEMCEWGDEDNEQLNRMQVSDVEGDKNVSGVFQAWDDDDDTYVNDFYCAMTGDFVIRIAQGTTVARGDLLMSAGDGTAKPQDDDIVRSKTIAKVTSTTVSTTYSDNSYCVPCVLMAC